MKNDEIKKYPGYIDDSFIKLLQDTLKEIKELDKVNKEIESEMLQGTIIPNFDWTNLKNKIIDSDKLNHEIKMKYLTQIRSYENA